VKSTLRGIHCCDNLDLLARQAAGSVDLVYIDPPFRTGRTRSARPGQRSSYADSWPRGIGGYLDFLRPRLEHVHRVLRLSGTIYVHLDWRSVHHVRLLLDDLFGARNFLNEIIWQYRTGGLSRRWFGRKHDNILVYARRLGRHTFHVARTGTFHTDGLRRDEFGRLFKSTRAGRLYFHQDGPAATDVWDIPFLSTVALERVGYPTQKPEALLRRIISASSNPRDLVADYFCGSGTTLAVARQLDRRWLGCDINPQAVQAARRRLTSRPKAQKKTPPGITGRGR
jgi:DNA modification methylase